MKHFAWMLSVAVLAAVEVRAAELYIVPVYGQNLRGSTASWSSGVLLNNPHAEPVDVEVAETYPNTESFCRPCPGPQRWTLLPFESLLLPEIAGPTGMLRLGAFSLLASRTIDVDSVILGRSVIPGDPLPVVIEPIEVGRRWIPANTSAYMPRVSTGALPVQINLFLVNPNESEIVVGYSVDSGTTARFDRTVRVPPNSTVLHPVIYPCPDESQGGCGADAPGGYRLNVRGSGEFYASASGPAFTPQRPGISTPLFIGPVF